MKDNVEFIINDYQKQKPFSSFLSGIAGKMGIPLWAFYVNRGQLIASFGVRDKNGAMMEFYPANNAYHYVSKIGFRTLVKVDHHVYEFFKEKSSNQSLIIKRDQVSIVEQNKEIGIEVKVTYFTLPNENAASLVRKVTIKNLDGNQKSIEVVDGLAQILPSGIDYGGYKAISNLLQSWMETKFKEDSVFYKLRASTGDSAEVSEVVDGNFYLTKGTQKPYYITDYKLIFDEDTSLETPYMLMKHSLSELRKVPQALVNQVPCAMSAFHFENLKEETFISLVGYAKDEHIIDQLSSRVSLNYLLDKEEENRLLHEKLVDAIETHTSSPLLDQYVKQCYLDNVLRGGVPIIFDTKDGQIGYHVYSRKHGDLERDYNFFSLEPAFYSQGNGNFRDVLQNRRNDLFFNPELKDFNIYQFGSLIQADGYNPLSIEGVEFLFEGDENKYPAPLHQLFKQPFTPGKIATILYQEGLEVEETLKKVLKDCHVLIKAKFGEGYWEDHFTYHYDLIDTYLSIYPDYMDQLMFTQKYPFFVSPVEVLPRSQKYVLTKDQKVRQYGAIKHDHHRKEEWLKNSEGIIKVNLYGKLLTLVVNKFAHLDPFGIGLSYEGNKPGWNDAMNGVPGLFGSGVSETMELLKLVKLLSEVSNRYPSHEAHILSSTEKLIQKLVHIEASTEYQKWDERMNALENYRKELSNPQQIIHLPIRHYTSLLDMMTKTLDDAIAKAKAIDPIYPTFLTYEASSYEPILDHGKPVIGDYGLPLVKVTSFKIKPLPVFLEAPARYLKSLSTKEEGKAIYQAVKATELYDKKMKFYQTSVSLDAYDNEIGRIRAFTKGWLERESNFLHMTYKYLLGLLKAGLYEEYFAEIKTNYTCFMDPSIYGRSPLENSSFLATSSNPDAKKHGQGFVSRLSGSTAEMLSMWRYMFLGNHIFNLEDGQLTFELAPKLPKEWFKDNQIKVKLFNQTEIVYHLLDQVNTYDQDARISHMTLHKVDEICDVKGSKIFGKWTKDIRDGYVFKINVYIIGGK
jgi:hypothetical protein